MDVFSLIPPNQLALFLMAGLVLNLTPGADVMFATACGLSAGPRAGAAAGLGVGLAGFWHVSLAALGLSTLLMAWPAALTLLKWVGAAYLLWLAWVSWRAGGPAAAGSGTPGITPLAAVRRGFLVNALNPKVALFATCFSNYNQPEIGEAALAVLAKNGIAAEVVYPQCCGMPHLEQGDLARVAESARVVSTAFAPYIEKGYDVVTLVPSCALMLKSEWPLLLPDDARVKALAARTFDIPEYIIDIARKEKLADGLKPVEGGVTLHLACHARAQNIGRKSADMLALIPGLKLDVIERCSGHGGSLGITVEFHETALKVGRPLARSALEKANRYVASECPLAALHIVNGMEKLAHEGNAEKNLPADKRAMHPIEIFAKAYGVGAVSS